MATHPSILAWKIPRTEDSDRLQPVGWQRVGPNWVHTFHVYIFGIFLELSEAAAAKSCQLCPILCDPIDGSPPGSRPWDSPGKNTGVGYHFLLQCMKVKSESEVAQSCLTLCDPRDCSPPGSSMGFSRQEYWSGSPVPRTQRSSTWQKWASGTGTWKYITSRKSSHWRIQEISITRGREARLCRTRALESKRRAVKAWLS